MATENGKAPETRRGVILFAICGAVAVVGELPVYTQEKNPRLITDEKILQQFRRDFDHGNIDRRKLTIENPHTWSITRGGDGRWAHVLMPIPTPLLTLLRPVTVNILPEDSDVALMYRGQRADLVLPVGKIISP